VVYWHGNPDPDHQTTKDDPMKLNLIPTVAASVALAGLTACGVGSTGAEIVAPPLTTVVVDGVTVANLGPDATRSADPSDPYGAEYFCSDNKSMWVLVVDGEIAGEPSDLVCLAPGADAATQAAMFLDS
jgi:hypothetical protein